MNSLSDTTALMICAFFLLVAGLMLSGHEWLADWMIRIGVLAVLPLIFIFKVFS